MLSWERWFWLDRILGALTPSWPLFWSWSLLEGVNCCGQWDSDHRSHWFENLWVSHGFVRTRTRKVYQNSAVLSGWGISIFWDFDLFFCRAFYSQWIVTAVAIIHKHYHWPTRSWQYTRVFRRGGWGSTQNSFLICSLFLTFPLRMNHAPFIPSWREKRVNFFREQCHVIMAAITLETSGRAAITAPITLLRWRSLAKCPRAPPARVIFIWTVLLLCRQQVWLCMDLLRFR